MCHMSHVLCHMSHANCHVSHVTCRVWHDIITRKLLELGTWTFETMLTTPVCQITYHMSHFTCHVTHVNCPYPYGIGAIQPYGSEALEAASSWLKRYDKYFTFRGNRKKAIRTVFKMRYLKSCYKLRKYIQVTIHWKKTCSSCSVEGHQRNSRLCISLGTIELEEEGFESD